MTSIFTWREQSSGAPVVRVGNALNPDGCKSVINELKDKTEQGTHVLAGGKVSTAKETRHSDIAWFNDLELKDTIRGFVDIANYEAGWRYDIVDCEQLQFTAYDGAKKQHYDWHTDGQGDHWCVRKSYQFHQPKEINLLYSAQTNLVGTVRKISVSAILNDDYEGGEMRFRTLHENSEVKETVIKPQMGDLIIFPSFIDHKVSPVTKGVRYSVVAWFGGPPFK